ncbi:MAG: bifunctional glutamate N-acetyltransferase/amino-acid acetyltransferase ArgJ [Lachnospiraceae bacterium]|jgi:glutamate N-acetyltransferase/amino-acid N-acetyltransferase|nr:bifunctional glutamate N-acetyltransferase/amino-acid acetyltransferase ArgJ [Lachnospiraceae bacterium]
MKKIVGGATAAKGYEASGVWAGIKKEKMDMALLYSNSPCNVAGTFTQNLVKAAPVVWDRDIVTAGGTAYGVVVNSGVANACTGPEGMKYCNETATYLANKMNIEPNQVLIGSTGVIGKQLPMDKIKGGIDKLINSKALGVDAGHEAAKAIMTTDTYTKEIAFEIDIKGTTVVIGGMAKGSGMIHPNMCTMLSFITTDAVISKELLQKALSLDVDETYNMISVDGDTSTNDTVLLLANGEAKNQEIMDGTEEYDEFKKALHEVNQILAMGIAGDGEGASALIESRVVGAKSKDNAKIIAKAIICSDLVKTAIAGHDANWGRVLCAMGYSGGKFNPDLVDLFFESNAGIVHILKDGVALDYDEDKATKILSAKEIIIIADLHEGDEYAKAWGCDLTHEYIEINADYRS